VLATTFVATLEAFCACTVTLKGVPAVTLLPPLTDVTASFVGPLEPTTSEPGPEPVAFIPPVHVVEDVYAVTVTVIDDVPTGVAPVVVIVIGTGVVPADVATAHVEPKVAPAGRPVTAVTIVAREVPPLVTPIE
jgi:hypothetical protein